MGWYSYSSGHEHDQKEKLITVYFELRLKDPSLYSKSVVSSLSLPQDSLSERASFQSTQKVVFCAVERARYAGLLEALGLTGNSALTFQDRCTSAVGLFILPLDFRSC